MGIFIKEIARRIYALFARCINRENQAYSLLKLKSKLSPVKRVDLFYPHPNPLPQGEGRVGIKQMKHERADHFF